MAFSDGRGETCRPLLQEIEISFKFIEVQVNGDLIYAGLLLGIAKRMAILDDYSTKLQGKQGKDIRF
jgi:hypothetical protein